MGLDIVEVIIRTEETFSIDLPDEECGRVQTVGDLYRLVLAKLNLDYLPAFSVENQTTGELFTWNPGHRRKLALIAKMSTSADVWMTLKALIVDQLQVEPKDISELAHFQNDLGAD